MSGLFLHGVEVNLRSLNLLFEDDLKRIIKKYKFLNDNLPKNTCCCNRCNECILNHRTNNFKRMTNNNFVYDCIINQYTKPYRNVMNYTKTLKRVFNGIYSYNLKIGFYYDTKNIVIYDYTAKVNSENFISMTTSRHVNLFKNFVYDNYGFNIIVINPNNLNIYQLSRTIKSFKRQ